MSPNDIEVKICNGIGSCHTYEELKEVILGYIEEYGAYYAEPIIRRSLEVNSNYYEKSKSYHIVKRLRDEGIIDIFYGYVSMVSRSYNMENLSDIGSAIRDLFADNLIVNTSRYEDRILVPYASLLSLYDLEAFNNDRELHYGIFEYMMSDGVVCFKKAFQLKREVPILNIMDRDVVLELIKLVVEIADEKKWNKTQIKSLCEYMVKVYWGPDTLFSRIFDYTEDSPFKLPIRERDKEFYKITKDVNKKCKQIYTELIIE